jgi:hypothetical protein
MLHGGVSHRTVEMPATIGAEGEEHIMRVVVTILVSGLFAYLLALWFSLVVWTFNDVRSRSQNIVTQLLGTSIVLLFNFLGLLLYYIIRPRQTLAEAYEKSLEEETLLQEIETRNLCPSCNHRIQDDFLKCPMCFTTLRRQCHFCNHLLAPEWSLCPYCGR